MSRCRMSDCRNKVFKDGLCKKHYELKQRNKCIVMGCDGEYGVNGMCQKHYRKWKRFSDSYVIGSGKTLGAKYSKHGPEIKHMLCTNTQYNGDCLEWTGYIASNGYGRLSINSLPALVHRIAWEIANGPVPEGLCVCHHCDNPRCIFPGHLFISDAKGNQVDCIQKGRSKCLSFKGERHLKAKLTEEQIMEIRASNEQGKALAERYGVAQTTISDIQKGKSWQHLPITDKHSTNKTHKLTTTDVMAIRHSSEGSNVLAKRYGVSRRTIDDARYGHTWIHLPDAKNIEEMSFHGKKFTPKDVLYIRASDESSLILAAKYEVNKSSIDNIRSRRTWANI